MFRVFLFFFLGSEFYGIICCGGAEAGGVEGGGCVSGSAVTPHNFI